MKFGTHIDNPYKWSQKILNIITHHLRELLDFGHLKN